MPRKRELDPIIIREIQKEVALYFEQNFPERYKLSRRHLPIYKASESIGEVFGALHAERTDRTHDPEVEEKIMREAVGKAVIALIDFSSRHSWSFEEVVREAWNDIKGENWDPYPDVGRPRKEEEPLTDD